MTSNSKVKLFCIYHRKHFIFANDAVIPIQIGRPFEPQYGVWPTDTGDNIDAKKDNYAELVAWYWVLKNYLPKHPEIEYLGFCHYRRFLDFYRAPNHDFMLKIPLESFLRMSENYTTDSIYGQIKDYDIVVPEKLAFKGKTIEKQYLEWHPQKDLEAMKSVINQYYPEYSKTMQEFLQQDSARFCLMATMKTELMKEFITWAFDVLFKVEKLCTWDQYHRYNDIRMPAFLIERFFNIWLEYNTKKRNFKVLERKSYFLDLTNEDKVAKLYSVK